MLLRVVPLGEIEMAAPSIHISLEKPDTGATWEYQGQTVSLLWQSKQARWIRSLVRGEFHAGSPLAGGFV